MANCIVHYNEAYSTACTLIGICRDPEDQESTLCVVKKDGCGMWLDLVHPSKVEMLYESTKVPIGGEK